MLAGHTPAEAGRGWPGLAEAGRGWLRLAEAGRGWPGLETAPSSIWRWRGVSKLEGELEGELAEASGRLPSHMGAAPVAKSCPL